MSLLPGAHFIENYMQILTEGGGTASRAPVGRMLFVSLMMAMGISIGKILILARLGLRDRLLQVPRPQALLLAHLHHADAARRGPHLAHL